MDIRHNLTIEQQFELKVFETEVRQLSQEDAHNLLIELREALMFQRMTFCEILKDTWGMDDSAQSSAELLAEG